MCVFMYTYSVYKLNNNHNMKQHTYNITRPSKKHDRQQQTMKTKHTKESAAGMLVAAACGKAVSWSCAMIYIIVGNCAMI